MKTWTGRYADEVRATRTTLVRAEALLEAVPLAREYKRDSAGQFSSGGGGNDGDGEFTPLVDPAVVDGVKIHSDMHVRAVDDPGGLLSDSMEPGRYVAVAQSAQDAADEGLFYTPAQARAIADQVDVVAAEARKATPPPHPADLDAPRPPAYEDGPAMLSHATAAGHPVSAYHDAYDDMGSDDLLVVGPHGGKPTWDLSGNEGVSMDLSYADAFASALRDMASAADG